ERGRLRWLECPMIDRWPRLYRDLPLRAGSYPLGQILNRRLRQPCVGRHLSIAFEAYRFDQPAGIWIPGDNERIRAIRWSAQERWMVQSDAAFLFVGIVTFEAPLHEHRSNVGLKEVVSVNELGGENQQDQENEGAFEHCVSLRESGS